MTIQIDTMKEKDFLLINQSYDLSDAGDELKKILESKSDVLYSIYDDDRLIGVSILEKDERAYLYIYINNELRFKGYGEAALKEFENMLKDSDSKEIVTSYNIADKVSKTFLDKRGYKEKFSSRYMTYKASKFEIGDLESKGIVIRKYSDEDFDEAFNLSAVAFHNMRISTGNFPKSVIAKYSEDDRDYWMKTKNERYIYTFNNEIIGHARIIDNEIDSVSIKDNCQGKGHGQNFIKHLVNSILSAGYNCVNLYCVVANKATILYEKMGFREEYTVGFATKILEN